MKDLWNSINNLLIRFRGKETSETVSPVWTREKEFDYGGVNLQIDDEITTLPKEDRAKEILEENPDLLRNICLEKLRVDPENLSALKMIVPCCEGEYKKLILNEIIQLSPNEEVFFGDLISLEFSVFLEEDSDIDSLVFRLSRAITPRVIENRTALVDDLIIILDSFYVKNPLGARDLALASYKAISENNENLAILLFNRLRSNMIDNRMRKSTFYSSKRMGRLFLAIDLADCFERRDEIDFERLKICETVVGIIFNKENEKLELALFDLQNKDSEKTKFADGLRILAKFSQKIFEYLSDYGDNWEEDKTLYQEIEIFISVLGEAYLADDLFSMGGGERGFILDDLRDIPLRHIHSRVKYELSSQNGIGTIISDYEEISSELSNDRRKLEIVLSIAKEGMKYSPLLSLEFLSGQLNERGSDERLLRLYAKNCEMVGDLGGAIESLSNSIQPSSIDLKRKLEQYNSWIAEGYDLDFLGKREGDFEPVENKVMYNVHACLPFVTSGYTIRTRQVAMALLDAKVDIEVNTRFGFPLDRSDYKEFDGLNGEFTDQGVTYRISPSAKGMNFLKDEKYCRENAKSLLERAEKIKPNAIISASDSSVGLASSMVSRYLGIPFIYEMRGLWALTRAANNPIFEGSTKFKLLMALERQCATSADLVLVISGPMKDLLISWGVNENRIIIMPNGVSSESERFPKQGVIENVSGTSENEKRELVFGYIGSIVGYEGLELLVDLVEKLESQGIGGYRIKIAGGGKSFDALQERVANSKVSGKIELLGRIPFEEVGEFYSEIDAIIIPRKRYPVTEIVPALKPLEAMAFGKCVICSDLSPNKELIDDGETGLLFKSGSASSLAKTIKGLLSEPKLCKQIGAASQKMVFESRSWDQNVDELVVEIKKFWIIAESKKPIPDTTGMISKIEEIFSPVGDDLLEIVNEEIEKIFVSVGNNFRSQRNIFLAFLRFIGGNNPSEGVSFFASREELADKRSIRSAITYSNRSGEYANSLFFVDKYGPLLSSDFVSSINKVAGRHSERFSTAEDIPRIPILDDVKPKGKREVNVACILDEFSFESYKHEANMVKLTKENYLEVLTTGDIDFLFTESAWNGNDGEFIYSFTGSLESNNAMVLKEIIEICNEYNIPTLFWNKEDPINYDQFIEVAKLFDYILTSDSNCIDDYKRDCPNSRVGSLAFACQPTIHNPIRNTLPEMDLCFGGSWYVREHGRRKERLVSIVEGSEKYDLHIYDRNFGTENRNKFPPRFSKFVKGKLTYSQMRMAYRIYDIMLNTNSVEDSPTMFSRRVFEIMASSTAVVSTPSIGMEQMLPEAIVCNDSNDVESSIKELLDNEIERKKLGHIGLRNVIRNHTYHHRMGEILQFLGIDDLEAESKKERKLVSIVCCSNRPQMIKNVKLNFEQQLYENVEMIVMLQASSNDFKEIKKELEKDSRIKVRKQMVRDSLGKTFNKGLKYCKGDFVAKFDDDDMYGPNYISDSIDAFNYTDADVVGKYGVFVYDEGTGNFYYRNKGSSNRYLQIVMGATIIAKREVFESVSFPDRTTGEDTEFLRRCLAKRMKIFSSNPFNWVLVRKKEEGFHTWDDKGSLTSGSSERLDISVDDIFI